MSDKDERSDTKPASDLEGAPTQQVYSKQGRGSGTRKPVSEGMQRFYEDRDPFSKFLSAADAEAQASNARDWRDVRDGRKALRDVQSLGLKDLTVHDVSPRKPQVIQVKDTSAYDHFVEACFPEGQNEKDTAEVSRKRAHDDTRVERGDLKRKRME
ncbi:uncharacterized protein KY384_008805 [Bacidia gigantensis]|uniref:uncharacterized protein n=1 Tax=Bacidia gigantensis TaxID=2732470 RepID=UPI001D047AB2|nr:uncharacterized protein KY384_008805 [Bacidia gigantensis]KAG8526604.1 hypothetical protein KY384_008805 [Bacidia gigantensis]